MSQPRQLKKGCWSAGTTPLLPSDGDKQPLGLWPQATVWGVPSWRRGLTCCYLGKNPKSGAYMVRGHCNLGSPAEATSLRPEMPVTTSVNTS